jgi:hypothetical protein
MSLNVTVPHTPAPQGLHENEQPEQPAGGMMQDGGPLQPCRQIIPAPQAGTQPAAPASLPPPSDMSMIGAESVPGPASVGAGLPPQEASAATVASAATAIAVVFMVHPG